MMESLLNFIAAHVWLGTVVLSFAVLGVIFWLILFYCVAFVYPREEEKLSPEMRIRRKKQIWPLTEPPKQEAFWPICGKAVRDIVGGVCLIIGTSILCRMAIGYFGGLETISGFECASPILLLIFGMGWGLYFAGHGGYIIGKWLDTRANKRSVPKRG